MGALATESGIVGPSCLQKEGFFGRQAPVHRSFENFWNAVTSHSCMRGTNTELFGTIRRGSLFSGR